VRSGQIAPDDERLLSDLVEMRHARVRDVMTPRVAMPWVEESAPPAKVKQVIRESDLSWVPVFRRSSDGEALGLMEVRRYLPAADELTRQQAPGRHVTPGMFLRGALFVPERARLDRALELFQQHKAEMALCVDEFGAVVGLVLAQQVADRLVAGELGAPASGVQPIARVAPNRWIVPGRLAVREFREFFERSLSAKLGIGMGISTVAGLLLARLGRVPKPGDAIQIGNIELKVESMSGRAIESVAISVVEESKEAAA
jgi:CBS domain containing-hemolysin-like protein